MSIGSYGTVRASDIDVNDLEIFFTYTPDRSSAPTEVFKIEDPTEVLSELQLPVNDQVSGRDNILGGMYNLRLPASTFNEIGIYNIYVRPRVIETSLVDCGVLSALPTVKGLIVSTTTGDLPTSFSANNAIQGYKIEYIDDNGNKVRNLARYVVTSNKVVPVTENIGDTSQTAVRYRFDDAGTLLFLQVTPSASSTSKPNTLPFIGKPNQTILLQNTFVNPISIEVELVENDIESLVSYIAGEQIKDNKKGIVTYYDSNREILKQFNLYQIDDDTNNSVETLYEVKEERTNIDLTQDFDDITSEV